MSGALAVNLLRRLSPLPDDYATAGPSVDELRPLYRKWRIWGVVLFFAGIAPSSAAWWTLFSGIAAWHADRFPPSVFHLRASGPMLALPCLFLGFATAWALLTFVYRRLLGERYAAYVRYDNLSSGFDGQRALRPILLGTFGLSFFFVAASLSWHVVFRDDRVAFHSWCGLGDTSKRYSEVKDIRSAPQLRAPNGNLVDRREYVVEFDDGSTWSTNFEPGDLDPQTKKQRVDFVAERAKKPVRELKVLE
jgi:hypothetical protein